jgi:hypothetical protein
MEEKKIDSLPTLNLLLEVENIEFRAAMNISVEQLEELTLDFDCCFGRMRLNKAGCVAHLALTSRIWLMMFLSQVDFKSSVSRSATTGDCATIIENQENH